MNIPIEQTIKKRRSVRTYEERRLSTEDKEKLMVFADGVIQPIWCEGEILLVEKSTASSGEKLGTYGVIKGASSYLGIGGKQEFGLEALVRI